MIMGTSTAVPSGGEDIGLKRLTAAELFSPVGPPVHVNHPEHHGDMPLHDHDFLEIALVEGGHGLHRTIRGRAAIGAGDAYFIHPGQWHGWEATRGLRLYNCCFGSELLTRELAWTRADPALGALMPRRVEPPLPGSPRPATAQGIIALRLPADDMARMIHEMEALRRVQQSADVVRARAEIVGRVLVMLALIARHADADGVEVRDEPAGGAVATVIAALEERLDHEWGLDELARLAGLNRSYLVRRFKRATGAAPMAYLARRRAEKAAVLLLTTELPIAEVARMVGWRDPNYFARRFRAAFGVTASAYRRQLPTPPLARAEDWIQW